MSAVPTPGGKWLRPGGRTQRAQRTTVTIDEVDFECEFITEGTYMPATDVDAAEMPVVTVLAVQVGMVDIWHLIRDTQLGERIYDAVERQVSS